MTHLLAVAVGGALGSAARYAITGASRRLFEGSFPVGTLLVNAIGCLLIGLLVPLMLEGRVARPEVRALVLIGLLGGLTTFSTFGYETFAFLRDGQWGRAVGNMVLHNAIGITLVLVGHRIGERLAVGT